VSEAEPACSSTAEQAADNRQAEVRLLPGRLQEDRRPGRPNGTKALAAEHLALNQTGEGSSPSGPTPTNDTRTGGPAAGHRTRNAATWVRVPPGALHSLTIRLRYIDIDVRTARVRRPVTSGHRQSGIGSPGVVECAHDGAAAYRLATAGVRVRLPLGT
jgi:hypothetical protein